MDVSDLDAAGKFRADASADHFLCRITFEGDLPDGMVAVGDRECIAAFSRLCTHMSCYLVDATSGTLPLDDDGRVRCQCACHYSSFDLEKHGLPINAPATACLPQIRLQRVPENPELPLEGVELAGWMANASVPYGVPYGGTSARPAADSES